MVDVEPFTIHWRLHLCTLVLRYGVYSANRFEDNGKKLKGLKKAVVENDFHKVCALFGEDEDHPHHIHLNKLWSFSYKGCTLHVPPLCVPICLRNMDILQWLLKHGANPNQLGSIHQKQSWERRLTSARFSPLMLALEDHPSIGRHGPFDPAVAAALVEGGADINSTAGGHFVEEEEEGGSIRYNHSITLLFRMTDPKNDPTLPPFKFLLDSGVDMWFQNGEKNWTALRACLDFPQCKTLTSFAKELIRYGGFTSSSSVEQSEFITLFKIWTQAVEEGRDDDVTFPQSTIHFLLDAGYRCSKVDIDHLKTSDIKNMDQCFADKVFGLHLYSLKQLCRMKIRRSVQHGCQLQKLKCLPQCMIDYLKFAEI